MMQGLENTPLLAPNGCVTNLSPEDWAYVRSAEFKAWAGDWEKGEGNVLLDENGEPKVLYHGSTRDFDRFDVSHGGDNTGIVEYTDPKTGEKILSDSSKVMFFTDYEPQAVNYAMLGRLDEINEIRRLAQEVASSIRAAKIGGLFSHFKSREEFEAAVEHLTPLVPSLKDVPHSLSALPQEEREALAAPVFALRDKYMEYSRQMNNGGLCNMYNNTLRQAGVVDGLIRDFDRLRRNDTTVQGEFGTLEEYNVSIFGASGNPEVSFWQDRDNGRLCYMFKDNEKKYLDEMSDSEAARCKVLMKATSVAAQRHFNQEVNEGGYGDATRVYRVFLKANKVLEHDYQGSAFPDKYKLNEKYPTSYVAARQVRRAALDGNDMVVYKNVRDPFEANTYGVFSNDQILIRDVRRGLRIDTPDLRREDESRALMLEYGIPEKTADFILDHGEGVINCDTYPRRSTPESPYDPACGMVKTDLYVKVTDGIVLARLSGSKDMVPLKKILESGRKRIPEKSKAKVAREQKETKDAAQAQHKL